MDKVNQNQPGPSLWTHFLVYFSLTFAIVSVAISAFYYTDYQFRINATINAETQQVALGHKMTRTMLRDIIRDLQFLGDSSLLQAFWKNPNSESRRALENQFTSLMQHKTIYDQIRFIDSQGMEQLRVNQLDGDMKAVPTDQLQDKSQRYYFIDTLKLDEDEIFVSPLDLNVESGEIEMPFKPMIRVGISLVNEDGIKVGVLIINYLAEALLDDLEQVMNATSGHTDLVNADGYWMKSHDENIEWGFMLGHRQSFRESYPQAWNEILAEATGQVILEQGLFTWQTIYPLLANTVSSDGSSTAYGSSQATLRGNDYFWKLLTHVPRDQYDQRLRQNLNNLVILFVFLLVIAAAGSFFTARYRMREKQSIFALETSKSDLEYLATHDELSGLHNRRDIMGHIEVAFQRAQRYQTPFSICMIDIDNFKRINDNFGHQVGDRVIHDIAKCFIANCRRSDTPGRYGGEEFLIILTETGIEGAFKWAESVRRKIETIAINLEGEDDSVSVSISCGVAEFDSAEPDVDQLIKRADQALYRAKEAGRNRVIRDDRTSS